MLSGEVAVVDRNNNRIQVFCADGTFVRAFGDSGDGAAKMEVPYVATMSPLGELYVKNFNRPGGTFSVYK